ncbi:hypothetical protein [Streptomyces sp. RKAG293]|uniref:hypothetical protein n=1 Tax=Streptomyces sp. RKAG293 TaxID=2893403 RepID=UPI0020339D62|nr:hypothetical protein [Streptomyces sp. RKAG293]MCM2417681.1 hypothetical protein [Streptomyces sp. RKAG293]
MDGTEDDELEQQLASALQDAISQTGGLQYQAIGELRMLLELPQVRRQLNEFSTPADQLLAVRASVTQAISAITEPQQVLRRGRAWSPELVSSRKIRDAISHLLNEVVEPLKSTGTQRRDHVIGLLELGIAVTSMRRREVGPEFQLMCLLARKLIALQRRPVRFERIEINYKFFEEYESPFGIRLESAYVSCSVETLRAHRSFEDTGFYLIPWRGVLKPSTPFTQYIYSQLAHYSDYAPKNVHLADIISHGEEDTDQERNPVLTVPFRGLWELGGSHYSYSITYPLSDRSTCARPGDENYELIAIPAGNMKGTVSIEITTPRPIEISEVGYSRRLIFNAFQAIGNTYHSIYQFDSLAAGRPFGLVIHWKDEPGKRDREFHKLATSSNVDWGEWLRKFMEEP